MPTDFFLSSNICDALKIIESFYHEVVNTYIIEILFVTYLKKFTLMNFIALPIIPLSTMTCFYNNIITNILKSII